MGLWNVFHRLLFPCPIWGAGGGRRGSRRMGRSVKHGGCLVSSILRAIPLPEHLHFREGWMSSPGTKKMAGPGWTPHVSVCPTPHSQPASADSRASLWSTWHVAQAAPQTSTEALPPIPAWTGSPRSSFGSLEPCVGQTGLCSGPQLHGKGLTVS